MSLRRPESPPIPGILLKCVHRKSLILRPPPFPPAEHTDTASLKETPHEVCVSTGSSEVPVSVLDVDVPVTAIDEVFVDDCSCTNAANNTSEIRAKSFVWSESAESKGTRMRLEALAARLAFRVEQDRRIEVRYSSHVGEICIITAALSANN